MKALSVIQPWAWLIIHGAEIVPGGKTIENRSWNTRHRGRVLVHASASAGKTLESIYQAQQFIARTFGASAASRLPHLSDGRLALGGIIGSVRIVDVVPPWAPRGDPWHVPGQFGFVLADPEPLPFRPCKGQVGLWGGFTVIGGLVVPDDNGAAR
jgi:hypothetical protein